MSDSCTPVDKMLDLAKSDTGILGQLLEKYRPLLILQARSIEEKLTQLSAEDIVQQTVEEICRDYAQFNGKTEVQFDAWIGRIHRNNIVDAIRWNVSHAEKHIESLGYDDQFTSLTWWEPLGRESSPSQVVLSGERARRIAEILNSLPKAQGEAVRLRHLEGLSITEISERLKSTPSAVAGLLKRGLKTLRYRMLADFQKEWQ